MRKILFNDQFQCKIEPYKSSLLNITHGVMPENYTSVTIPHDALIQDANNFYTDNVIWYRKKMGIIPSNNKRLIIYFEGVYMDASIYINEQFVGRWVNGYTSFWFDITDFVHSPDDYLYVSIDYRCPNARWYGGPGINRDIWLYEVPKTHFLIDSLYVCPCLSVDGCWKLNATVEIDCAKQKTPILPSEVVFHCEKLGLHKPFVYNTSSSRYELCETIDNPTMWDIDNPFIYHCYASLSYDGAKEDDTISTSFGFRHIEMSPETGLYLNGRHIKLQGVCLHSDQGCLGTAFYEDMARRQLKLMKDMGANAIRLGHHAQAPRYLDICDELGLLVFNEIFDCWTTQKTEYDYARFFKEWYSKDIRSWVMRDRNHPSVFLWSAGNEIYDTHSSADGANTLLCISNEIKRYDYFNHAKVALCSNYMAWDNTIKAVDLIKFAGYNYCDNLYDSHHKEHPDWIIFGSETGSLVQSRGIYHFPLKESLLVDDDNHCSSLGNCSTSWGAPTMDKCVITERDNSYSLGQFIWSGIDYLGEPTPYHTKSSYFGIVDTATFPKDIYYMLQSCWRSYEDYPMIHLLPYWDFNDGQIIDIRICSNTYEVELFFNDISLGRKKIDHEHDMIMYADYQLSYSAGTLRAVGYNKNGEAIVTSIEKSFGDTASLMFCMNSNESIQNENHISFDVNEGDTQLRFIEISAIDKNGHCVKNASDRINLSISGPATLIGICNGNQTDMDSFQGNSMRLFSGKLLAIVKPSGTKGTINIMGDINKSNIPVRKLEIHVDDSNNLLLTSDNNTITAHITVYPYNAYYKSIEYQITNLAGVPIQNAQISNISDDELTITIKAIADSEFNLRALCREADDRVTIISSISLKAEGFGELYKNPYSFVSASLYDDYKGTIGNGNEKGIATPRLKDTYILYKNMNFGEMGTKEVTLPIFELAGLPVKINFWKGMPHGEDSVLIGEKIYHKPSIWNVYQEETFILDTPLTGITDFGIEVINDKIHIKGFIFHPYNATYDMHLLKDAKSIYGDQFEITDELIKEIGNNVCITYKDMDFGDNKGTKIEITGHTPLKQNTVHIRFNNGNSELKQIVEFPHSEELITHTFNLEPICGKGDISFIFFPGSNFDFKAFRFIRFES